MAGLTDAYENKGVEHFLRGNVQTPDASLYLELLTALPNDDGTGGSEVVAGDYARQPISFAAAAAGQVASGGTNGAQTFTASATTAWGSLVGLAIRNSLSGGSRLAVGLLKTPLIVGVGSQVAFAAGKVTVKGPSNWVITRRNAFLEHFFRNNAQAAVTAGYFGVMTTEPAADGSGIVEPAAVWYARQAVALGAASGGISTNTGAVSFVTNAGQAGGTATHGGLFTGASGSTLVVYYPLSVALALLVGSTLAFPPGQISAGLD